MLVLVASSYFYLPIEDEDEEDNLGCVSTTCALPWVQDRPTSRELDESDFTWSSASSSSSSLITDFEAPLQESSKLAVIQEILTQNDLYEILGVSRKAALDRLALRRAYLSRSKACHPEWVSSDSALTI
jgi:hypothetical protein